MHSKGRTDLGIAQLNLKIEKLFSEYSGYRKKIFVLILIMTGSLLIRLIYFIPEQPLSLDSLSFFFYALDIAENNKLPETYSVANNGWPIFVAIFFKIFNFENALSYMQLQRILSVSISVATIPVVYFFGRKYFSEKYSFLAAILFAFEPRLIQNSLLGITDSLYIFLITISFVMFLSKNLRVILGSFATISIATMVRPEGLFVFLGLSIAYFIRFRKERKNLTKYVLVLGIFFALLLPMSAYRIQVSDSDHLFLRASQTISDINQSNSITENSDNSLLLTGLENFPKYLGWDLIPIYIIFVPIGFVLLLKNLNFNNKMILSLLGAMSIPAFYAYSIPIPETRYFYYFYPIFSVLSVIFIQKTEKVKLTKLIFVGIIIGVLISSTLFLELKLMQHEKDKEIVEMTNFLVEKSKKFNSLYPESRFVEGAYVITNWNSVKEIFHGDRIRGEELRFQIERPINELPIKGEKTLYEYILQNKNAGLTHIIVDDKENRAEFLKIVFNSEEEFPYLVKIYDSNRLGYNYKIKIFEIDYTKFEEYNS